MRTDDFDYNLPEELIAQEPAAVRDECRLLVMDRESGEVEDRIFKDIVDYLRPGDLLVANETRVMPARLLGAKRGTGGAAEVFLLRECGGPEPRTNRVAFWEVLVRPGKRLKPGAGAVVDFTDAAGEVALSAEIIDWARDGQRGERVARLSTTLPSLDEALHAVGHTPLPPYIRDYAGDEELYQTVYSRRESSAAAPTAGLHFHAEPSSVCARASIGWSHGTAGSGSGHLPAWWTRTTRRDTTSAPSSARCPLCVGAMNEAHARGGRVIAMGTGVHQPGRLGSRGRRQPEVALSPRDREATSLYILPGYPSFPWWTPSSASWPRSTLMMLVSAFSTRENILAAYQHAIDERYRLLSFGDAMFLH